MKSSKRVSIRVKILSNRRLRKICATSQTSPARQPLISCRYTYFFYIFRCWLISFVYIFSISLSLEIELFPSFHILSLSVHALIWPFFFACLCHTTEGKGSNGLHQHSKKKIANVNFNSCVNWIAGSYLAATHAVDRSATLLWWNDAPIRSEIRRRRRRFLRFEISVRDTCCDCITIVFTIYIDVVVVVSDAAASRATWDEIRCCWLCDWKSEWMSVTQLMLLSFRCLLAAAVDWQRDHKCWWWKIMLWIWFE